MIIGHYVIRTYRKFKNQGLGTRFVIVGIPLIPVQSFYMFKDSGKVMEVDLYWKQAVKVYFIMISVFYLLSDTSQEAVIMICPLKSFF